MCELNNNGFEAYIVGGCVRDSLLGVVPKDWDIATNAMPNEIKEIFSSYYLIPTGEKYGTMTVLLNKVSYEITTYRADGSYGDGRRPNAVNFSNTIKDDLCRRDFSINAMAYNDEYGIIDLFGGQSDLKNKIIKTVGNAENRFNENALRIMRAIRFATTLDFDISKEVINAIFECGDNLKNISMERKNAEIVKILCAINKLDKDTYHYPKLRGMIEYIIKRIIPEFIGLAQITHNNIWHYTDVFTHTMDMIFFGYTDDIELIMTILLHDIGKLKARVFDDKRLTNHYYGHEIYSVKMAQEIMHRMRFDNKTIEIVLKLVEAHDFVLQPTRNVAKKLLNKLGHDLCIKLFAFQLIDKKAHRWGSGEYDKWVCKVSEIKTIWHDILFNNEAFTIRDLAINGYDLINIGFVQGKILGEILNNCLEYVIDNPDKNNKESLIAFVVYKYNLVMENNDGVF